MRKKYQRKDRKSNHKFEIVRGQELLVQVPLPMAEVWAEMQAQVEGAKAALEKSSGNWKGSIRALPAAWRKAWKKR